MHSRRDILQRGLALFGVGGLGAGLSGCTDTGAAYAAWDGPPPGLSDPRLRLASWASLAPSSHNLQPWRLRLDGEDALRLFIDPQRLHPATDPAYRQTTISQGTFLELFDMAAGGLGMATEVTVFPDGPFSGPEDMGRRPVARIALRDAPERLPPPLFAAVRRRRSSKVVYTGRAVSIEERRHLAAAVEPVAGVAAGFVDRGAAMERLRALVLEGIRAEMTDPGALEEIARIMRLTPRDVLAHRDGLVPLPGAAGWVADLLFGAESLAEPDSFMTRSGLRQMAGWAESATAFVWLTTPGNTRAEQIAAGRAYMRLDLAAAAAGVAIHPMSQALQDVPVQAAQYAAVRALLLPEDGTVQMLARLGQVEAPPPPTPRRPVSALVDEG